MPMTESKHAFLAGILCSVLSGNAFGQDTEQPPPESPQAIVVDHWRNETTGTPQTVLRFKVPGCWIESKQHYSNYDDLCSSARVSLYRRGRYFMRLYNELDVYDPDYSGSPRAKWFVLHWSCSRTGRFEYRVRVTNWSYKPDGKAWTKDLRGAFTVPRCRRPEARFVGRGFASAVAANSYRSEYVSSIQCRPTGLRRGRKSSGWTCDETHNNSYRECVSTYRYRYTSTDKYGLALNGWRARRLAIRCRYF